MIIHLLLGKVQELTHKNNYPILQRMGEVTPNHLEWKQGAHNWKKLILNVEMKRKKSNLKPSIERIANYIYLCL
jgi:hypothetical protein